MDAQNLKITIQKAQNADVRAFSDVVEYFEPRLKHFCVRMGLVGMQDQEDCLQEAFLKVWKNLKAYDDTFSFQTWLYRIVRNEVYSFYRKNKPKNTNIELKPELWHENLVSECPVEQLHAQDRTKMVQKALNKLKKEQKELLVLYYAEEMSYAEIADVLKRPVNTVATQIRRAKASLLVHVTPETP